MYCNSTDKNVCVNDGVDKRRNSESVFLIKSRLNRNVSRCVTLTPDSVSSDHIAILMEAADGATEVPETVERYQIHKSDWEKWDIVPSENSTNDWRRCTQIEVQVATITVTRVVQKLRRLGLSQPAF